MAAHYFPGPTISKRYTTLRDATLSRPAVRETFQNLCLKIWLPRTRGYVVKIKSYATLTSC